MTDNDLVISLADVSVRYRVPHERIPTIKEYAIRWLRRRIRYQDFWALRSVSLEVHRNEVLGIIGANGAGKSTLLKVVARVLQPTSGRVRLWGRVAPLLELGAGFDPELTGRENIFLNGTILGFCRNDIAGRIDRIVEFAGLEEFIDAPLRTYSSGMYARLGFAVATDIRPEILIIDEILSVGDAAFQEKSFDRVRSFLGDGTTVLLVSHSLDQIARLCQRVAWLQHGELVTVGPPDEVIARYRA
ncbi:MAG: ABC transporter ATP-binding protein [Acidobacteria bacterium]|nr:ABC transporter ATP-binding protein [Acidobacteriota bacterium]